ncbi:23S rRNA (adenine(2503)-C(2))-methyltransferase RlmN [Entomospira culicis]|uniref:23S rRNA (Adenine(2503)-C(2))-methyltransferase RlmN n=1 Tax=Entomospira culicis TaxID=2719989 RepID=A0A968GE12_9SPIO|nr:23S rRNA (adenine(2503)-C(2))-methyltransferase RlmN [Entomospira culicis]NIZ18593.1 23S rRNA (adenine(2503)-C(2))-methyltransferase RlmN [Entomospira culicis]NIZ68808.1 23S rRNA (adenine(2503)-C(2))-methyltransferase RlmN [Entomospira culicis]WDI37403.1 23S rRNA (adenine(2503)-C(2))-methyltransferase RlmN [Entomospira culicis]WDI39032.1 23S rRNA (adenine(2503)-C(2))-methyltransferase RlmN [Entomospira culicis]
MMLTSYTLEELHQKTLADQPKFRAKQLWQALYHHKATHVNDIHVWPAALRENFSQPNLFSSKIVKTLTEDKQVKLVIELHDQRRVETVLLVDKNDRKTACLSSQVGCAMGCTFCKTGTLGLTRNLEVGEIIEQFLFLQNNYGTLDNVVFMGMGEPTANLLAVLKTIRLLGDKESLHMSPRRFTISTCGITSGIRAIADANPQIGLAFSLVTANDEKRPIIMPSAKKNPLPELKSALLYYQQKGGRRITLEMALLPDYNMSKEDARKVAQFGEGLEYIANIIPWNPVAGLPYRSPTQEEIDQFSDWLEDFGVPATRRYRRASTIAGACGQLGEG